MSSAGFKWSCTSYIYPIKKQFPYGWWWHAVYWLLYLCFKVYHEFIWLAPAYEDIGPTAVLASALMAQSMMSLPKVGLAYALGYGVIDRLNGWRGWGVGLIIFVLFMVVYRLAIVFVVLPVAYAEMPERQSLFQLNRLTSGSLDMALAVGIFLALLLYQRQQEARYQAEQAKKEKVKAELHYLKQQIHPHFLFNTLNSLYGLAKKQSTHTADAIHQLSQLIRFLLYETRKSSIPLEEEIRMIQQYVALERLRYGDRLQLTWEVSEPLVPVVISPGMLLTLVENAFTHGAGETESNPIINIRLSEQDGKVLFEVINSMGRSKSGLGIGLSNIRRQMELAHPDYKLTQKRAENHFITSLYIPIAHESHAMFDS